MLLPYWDRSGTLHELEPPPSSYHNWTRGQDVLAQHHGLHEAAYKHLGSAVVRTLCRSDYMNITLDATLDNGKSVILRQRHTYSTDQVKEKWSRTRFENETKLLQWLRNSTNLPIPAILALGQDYTIQEKLPGSNLAYHWSQLTPSAKERCISAYVDVLWSLFRLRVPQQIGSSLFEERNGTDVLTVGPLLAANLDYLNSEVLDSIVGYLRFLLRAKQKMIYKMKSEDIPRAEVTLSFVERNVVTIAETIKDPSLLRCVLTHGDPHGHNILVAHDGNITGVLDWEFNYILPGILAIDYPLWLSTEGRLDPRFASDFQWWEESPHERRRLCSFFEKEVRERDAELFHCLAEGRVLRAAVGWLLDTLPDPGLERMGKWASTTFQY